jgi:4-hydroxythreonine-4-phosphate dehydrogenase
MPPDVMTLRANGNQPFADASQATFTMGQLLDGARRLEDRPWGSVRILDLENALRETAETLTAEKIIEAATVAHRALIADFAISTPRLAVTGLNPHAGEDGVLGTEERDIIEPAMGVLTRQGVNVIGPLPADTAFHAAARKRYDAILGMYHDQALIPVKTLAFDEGVNVTLGLPFVRTSPDHGTAFDIAGTGKARPDSLIAALKLASDMAMARAMRHEAEV